MLALLINNLTMSCFFFTRNNVLIMRRSCQQKANIQSRSSYIPRWFKLFNKTFKMSVNKKQKMIENCSVKSPSSSKSSAVYENSQFRLYSSNCFCNFCAPKPRPSSSPHSSNCFSDDKDNCICWTCAKSNEQNNDRQMSVKQAELYKISNGVRILVPSRYPSLPEPCIPLLKVLNVLRVALITIEDAEKTKELLNNVIDIWSKTYGKRNHKNI